MKEIVIATKNKGKIKDFELLFQPYSITVKSLLDLEEIQEIEETGTTFEENAAIKAETISKLLNKPVIADDSGIEIDALDGAPGVYSARYAGTDKDDEANNQKVLDELKDVAFQDRTARFVCVLAIAEPDKPTIFKRGECEGHIGLKAVGENGFGYDPLFYPLGCNKTMAQLTPEEKNKISHRKKALEQLHDWIRNEIKES